jgi:hypothetical protein
MCQSAVLYCQAFQCAACQCSTCWLSRSVHRNKLTQSSQDVLNEYCSTVSFRTPHVPNKLTFVGFVEKNHRQQEKLYWQPRCQLSLNIFLMFAGLWMEPILSCTGSESSYQCAMLPFCGPFIHTKTYPLLWCCTGLTDMSNLMCCVSQFSCLHSTLFCKSINIKFPNPRVLSKTFCM